MSETLNDIARAMVTPGKGILAADESTATIKKRFDTINTDSTADSRRDYREMLFRTDVAMRSCISGVILYDETIRQKAADGTPLVTLLQNAGSVPGIKVDTGAKDLAGFPGEKVTEGLDGLRDRLAEYYEIGARFAKWRGVITIGDGMPSAACITANAHALARYAALCQEQKIVPIVEPEVLMDNPGADHTIDQCDEVTRKALNAVFAQLAEQGVALDGIVLKPNMVIAAKGAARQASAEEVAKRTVACLRDCVPADVPGIAFLSGGQDDLQATHHLSLMNAAESLPWNLTFSYGRALQAPALKAWGGMPENVPAAQAAFSHRANMNALATLGEWSQSQEMAA
ncbi:MAG: fructose-bisphosphate aldolase class I [Alphaproteobacteria bacterium]|nr:fructose-bisphosphate aldolase class I [Alphaproteobacteria bacterium]